MSRIRLILGIYVILIVYKTYSQGINICRAVNGDTTGWSPAVLSATSTSQSYCPNTGNCVYLQNTEGTTQTYNVNNGVNLRFEIDYELDVLYGNSDRTEIYYNCDGTKRLLYTVRRSNNNADLDNPYRDIPIPLPGQYCDQVSSVAISIEQTIVSTGTKYFNFQNACIYGDTSFSPTLNPSKTPSKTPTMNPSKTPTMTPTKKTRTPTGTPTENTNPPTMTPSMTPSLSPTKTPSVKPTESPSQTPTMTPTEDTINPTTTPTKNPTVTFDPTLSPTEGPTVDPTLYPTKLPTSSPSVSPSLTPTATEDVPSPPTTPVNIQYICDISFAILYGSIYVVI